MISLALVMLVLGAEAERPEWLAGPHLTGHWEGRRTTLEEHGFTLGLGYSAEGFANFIGRDKAPTLLGHIDLSLELDTGKLGLWSNGKLFVLGQNDHGTGINTRVGSANTISNLEDSDFTQFTELFFEQTWLDERILLRLGKQDASRDFALSPYGSDFINNNFGMFPTSPLPNYAATGLGAALVVSPLDWLITRAAIFEGSPEVGSLGFDTAFRDGAGFTLVAGAAVEHTLSRAQGTTSASIWRQTRDDFPEHSNWGFFVQHDEHLRSSPDDEGGLVATARFSWAPPDRNAVSLYAGFGLTWIGIGPRASDSVGIGVGYLGLTDPLPGSELHLELFYKMLVTPFINLQPTVQLYRSPGAVNPDAFIAGVRFDLVL